MLRNTATEIYFLIVVTTYPESFSFSQWSVLKIITPLPLCVAALKSNEYAVKFRLFWLKGNCTYIGNVRRSHIYSRCKFAAGGCSEKLKCLQGARNWRKVVIHQTVSRLARWRRLGEQCAVSL